MPTIEGAKRTFPGCLDLEGFGALVFKVTPEAGPPVQNRHVITKKLRVLLHQAGCRCSRICTGPTSPKLTTKLSLHEGTGESQRDRQPTHGVRHRLGGPHQLRIAPLNSVEERSKPIQQDFEGLLTV